MQTKQNVVSFDKNDDTVSKFIAWLENSVAFHVKVRFERIENSVIMQVALLIILARK